MFRLCRDCGVNEAAAHRADCLSCRKGPDQARRANDRYGALLESASARGVAVSLTEPEYYAIIASGKCFYCRGQLPATGYCLDLKDPEGIYSLDNVVPCCWKPCNRGKGNDISHEDFRAVMRPIFEDRQRKEVWAAGLAAQANQ
jgi:hypothetical protein